MKTTETRKKEHLKIALNQKVETAGTGLERFRFAHHSLPELDFSEISVSTSFLGKTLKAPFMITAATGGFEYAGKINRELASACEKHGIAFGLGSQRAMLESASLSKTFKVRDIAPKVFLAGNIGAAQLNQYPSKRIQNMLDEIEADALCIHLNPLQEALQMEGDKNWKGCLSAIEKTCSYVSVPVIAKEVGSGISAEIAKELEDAGVSAIDVSGLGGTSWSSIEYSRSETSEKTFSEWGIPTSESIQLCAKAVKIPLIASGGLRSGLDAAKCIRLGASLSGAALPFLKSLENGGMKSLDGEISRWIRELKTAMFLTRSKNLSELKKAQIIRQ